MAAPTFYNKGDQAIYNSGMSFVPQEKYRLGYTAPTVEEQKIEQTFGIPATNAFTNSGDGGGGSGGNAFGYGTAIKPGDPSVLTSGPYQGQSGYSNSLNYSGGLPGNVSQKGPGRHFEYDNTGAFYKDYSLTPRREVPGLLRAGAAFVPFGNFALNQIENKMNPEGPFTKDDNPYGGNYGIAGLSNAQKEAYNSLAAAGGLFEGPSGMKTITGKNFNLSDKQFGNYMDKQRDIYNDFAAMTEEELAELTPFEKLQYKEASALHKDKIEAADKAYKEQQIADEKEMAANPNNPDGKPAAYNYAGRVSSGGTHTSTISEKDSQSNIDDARGRRADGGRVGYFFGGRVNYKAGGRIGFQGGGGQIGGTADMSGGYNPGPGDTGGEGGTNPSDGSDTQFGGGNNSGASDNPPVTVVNNPPPTVYDNGIQVIRDQSKLGFNYPTGLTKNLGIGQLTAILDARKSLEDEDLEGKVQFDSSIGPVNTTTAYDTTTGPEFNASYTNNNFNANLNSKTGLGVNYSKDIGPGTFTVGGGIDPYGNYNTETKYGISFANGGLASIL